MPPGPAAVTAGYDPSRLAAAADPRLEATIAERVGSTREARWIVEHAEGDGVLARALADRRASGEPLQYVLGRWPFRTLELAVDPRVLIPRPETEQVVEVALAELATLVAGRRPSPGRPGPPGPVAVDLGTGSGAIALSLAVEGGARAPTLEVWATDVSPAALAVAQDNLAELARCGPRAAGRVRMAAGRWFDALPPALAGTVDLVVSNPPYVAEAEFPGLEPIVRGWEPRGALVAPDRDGVGGLADIGTVLVDSARWLRPGGVVVVEISPAQADAALGVARRAGLVDARTEEDLSGRVRMVVARR